MFKKNKKRHKNNRNKNRDISSTFDSKLHHRSKRSSGYGLKHGVEQDPAELHGSQLQGMLDKWNSKD